jgi:sterol desaturase/sphingolipid hydroxylase (fatty acid hydroxylase superfamily)
LEKVNRARLVRLWPYAAAIGVLAVCLAVFIAFERQAASDLWTRALGFVEANWRRVLGPGGQMIIFTIFLMVLELFFLSWEKTTVFLVFVQRRMTALSDFGLAIAYFTPLKLAAEYFFSFGLAYGGARLVDKLGARLDWVRWELPSNGALEVIAGFSIYFLASTFVSYWHHRLMHWRGFWYLHRFHHATPELNIFSGFRENPATSFLNLLPALSPLILLKTPNAGLFAAFFVAYQMLASLQHSQLPWNFGWVGRWLIVSPQNHQIHHSIDEEHRDLNFSVCPLWDRMFGTWYAGSKRPSAYGISDPLHVERPLTQWLVDIWIFYRDIARATASIVQSALARIARRRPTPQDAPGSTASIPAE